MLTYERGASFLSIRGPTTLVQPVPLLTTLWVLFLVRNPFNLLNRPLREALHMSVGAAGEAESRKGWRHSSPKARRGCVYSVLFIASSW